MKPERRMSASVDHILLIGFGGPPRPEDVTPFLEEVARGLNIPAARLAEVARHYERTGGASPYNEHAFRLFEKLLERLRASQVTLPIFIGMRNWHPFLRETIREIHEQRLCSGLGVILAPHRSYASFDRYLENVEDAKRQAGAEAIRYEYLRPWHNHPLFIQAQAARVREAFERMSPADQDDVHLLFSAHSIPVEMAAQSRYAQEVRESSSLVAQELSHKHWGIAYQSRSGNPNQPWLEPDVVSALRQLKARGTRDILVVPIGFLSDHTEVLYDLDVEAREEAERISVRYYRASTVMDHSKFVNMFTQLILEHLQRLSPATA